MAGLDSYFIIPPDWKEKVKISHVWRTSIKTAKTGHEKRASLWTKKRKRISFSTLTISREELAWLQANLFESGHKQWGFPLWPDRAVLISQASVGDLSLKVNSTEFREFETGKEFILIGEIFDSIEVKTISNILPGEIFFNVPLTHDWPVGSDVYPVISSRISDGQILFRETTDTVKISVDATETLE